MSLPDKVRGLSNPMLVLHVFSKLILGIGLGIVLAPYLASAGWLILGVGVILSIFPVKSMFCMKGCCCQKEE